MAPSSKRPPPIRLPLPSPSLSVRSFTFEDGDYASSPSTPRTGQWIQHQLGRSHRAGWIAWLLPAIAFVLGVGLSRMVLGPETVTVVETRVVERPAPSHDQQRMDVLATTDALPTALANNFALTSKECDAGFPRLWGAVDDVRGQFEEEGVTRNDLDAVEAHNGTLVAIVDNQLYVKRFHGEWKKRNEAILASLYQAVITSPESIPDVEFWFRATDSLDEGGWFGLMKKPGERLWLLPDFGLYSWPEPGLKGWSDYRRRVAEVESRVPWKDKIDKLFFRGVASLSPLRGSLIRLAAKHNWGDVRDLDWGSQEELYAMEDHCKFRWLASIEGLAAYSGRLKYLLQCRSVVVSHRMDYTQHFHGALDSSGPDQNIVQLSRRRWEGLEETMDQLQGDDALGERIAENAVRTMRDRYLTPAATACYWRRVLKEYAGVQKFVPEIGEGVDYESFSLLYLIKWKPF